MDCASLGLPTPDAPAIDHPDPTGALEQAALGDLDPIIREFLDCDSRPTLIIDLDPDYIVDHRHCIRPVYSNPALHDELLESITRAPATTGDPAIDTTTHEQFQTWATGTSRCNDSRDVFPLTLHYRNLLWTGYTVRRRWRVISGNALFKTSDLPRGDLQSALPSSAHSLRRQTPESARAATPPPAVGENSQVGQSKSPPSAALTKDSSKDTSGSSGSAVIIVTPDNMVPDWTVPNPVGTLPDHVLFVRSVDWASTPLGPMAQWSLQFREIVNILMRNPHPAALFWGEELSLIYNEAYSIEVAGNKHPELLGTGFSGKFSELWEGVVEIFQASARTGQSIRKENDPLPMIRYGYLEETFFSWSFTPVFGGTNKVLGFYNAPFETTYQTISSRRMSLLRYLGESLNAARTVKQFWKKVLEGLEHNQYDVPFALLYSIMDVDDASTASHSSDSTIGLRSCILEGSLGIPKGHPASPHKLDLKRSQEGFVPAFREAMRTREPTTLHMRDGSLPESLLEGITWRGFGDPCKDAIIFPVRPTNGDSVCAFLLVGINPRRAYDDDYKAFAAMLNRQLATSLASVLLFEDEVRRSRNAAEAAAQQREQLSQQLEVQTSRMRRMTELSPLGMYLFNPEGVLLEANETYYEMTGHRRDNDDELSFLSVVDPESLQSTREMWEYMMTTHKASTREIQLNNTRAQPRDLDGQPIEYWVLASSQPEIGANSEVVSIMGSITDISHMKWAQGLQERRLRESEETKRQQNEFIDITSHEMRNPLSAILMCADDIRDTLMGHSFAGEEQRIASECIEAADNIALCVQHQKAIVDDILTVSKLDSNLLLITPVPTQPVAIVHRAMSMFKPEVQAKDIDFSFVPNESLQRLDIDWLLMDPSRLLQITVNLITNAIKFTQHSAVRNITVHVSASTEQPTSPPAGFEFVPTRSTRVDIASGEEWGLGQLMYLEVQVQDTGCGLTKDEKALLFERFAQASPRTHAHYGGSGLGLFISRQLAELHGGQIGVSSEADLGSTFGFFLQCRSVVSSGRPVLSRAPSNYEGKHKHVESSMNLVAAVASNEPHVSNTELPIRFAADKLHVLIVEDNLVNQKVLSKQLTKFGCVISTADNGLFALEQLAKTSFYRPDGVPLSVILMDLEMPEMNGLECASRIRQMEQEGQLNAHVPIIAVTANVRGEQIATAKDSGCDDVVGKPFRVPELLVKIQALLKSFAE
ncbi:hypothetical protein ACN47E_002599 [Coniothyrium glycines]